MNYRYSDVPQVSSMLVKGERLDLKSPSMKNVRILLVGMGADIGSNLLYLSSVNDVAYPITDVLTHSIESEGVGAESRNSLDELKARLLLANPLLIGKICTDNYNSVLTINNRSFVIHFRDLDSDLSDLGYFNLAVLATSRRHIRSKHYLDKLETIARVVLGVAENSTLPALYPALVNVPSTHFLTGRTIVSSELAGSYAIGSCQCVGWTTGLRILADYCTSKGAVLHELLLHTEVDIVHPDTASSNFGTQRVGSRTEDPRDNIRPGISQVADSMLRFPPTTSSNNVSLRVLTQPPGYQIQRFFLRGIDVKIDSIIEVAKALEDADPSLIHVTNMPIGSRAYAYLPASVVLLITEQHLSVKCIGDVVEVVMQAFVHNTLGYCAAILSTIEHILSGNNITLVDSNIPVAMKVTI
jgi:hypothetical protein